MAMKRKRSSQSLGLPVETDRHTGSQLACFFSPNKPQEHALSSHDKSPWPYPLSPESTAMERDPFSSPAHLPSRTRKRHRDDRPDEEEVYAHTLQRLFDAQRQRRPHPSPDHSAQSFALPTPPASASPSDPFMVPAPHQPQRSTLHRFWNIQTAPTASPERGEEMAIARMDVDCSMADADDNVRCEDCEREMRFDGIENTGLLTLDQLACQYCRRRVCDLCSIRWDRRTCLACANSR